MAQPELIKSTTEDHKKCALCQTQVEIDDPFPDISNCPLYLQSLEEARKMILQLGGTLCD